MCVACRAEWGGRGAYHNIALLNLSSNVLPRRSVLRELTASRFAMPPKRVGGAWQRRMQVEDEAPQPSSELAFYLVTQVLWGAISPEYARQIAKRARHDISVAQATAPTYTFKELDMLAELSESHTYEQLVRKLEAPKIPLSSFQLSMRLNDVVSMFEQWAIWPHEMFAALYHHYPSELAKRI